MSKEFKQFIQPHSRAWVRLYTNYIRLFFTIRLTKIQKFDNTPFWWDWKIGILCISGGNSMSTTFKEGIWLVSVKIMNKYILWPRHSISKMLPYRLTSGHVQWQMDKPAPCSILSSHKKLKTWISSIRALLNKWWCLHIMEFYASVE